MGPGWPDETVERARARVGRALFGARADVRPIVGRYEIEGPVPPLGLSARFVARDPSTGLSVVLQFLPDADDLQGRSRLRADACARLLHPNVVPVMEVVEHAGTLVLVMERVRGEVLRSWVERRARSVEDIVSAYLEVASGLEAGHALRLAHRGFASDRAVREPDGRVRVLAADLVCAARRATVCRDVAAFCDSLRSSLLLASPFDAASERVHVVLDRWRLEPHRNRVGMMQLRDDLRRAL